MDPVHAILSVNMRRVSEVDVLDCPLAFSSSFFVFKGATTLLVATLQPCTLLEIVVLNGLVNQITHHYFYSVIVACWRS